MKTKTEIENVLNLIAIKEQVEKALNENSNRKSNKQLIHDWLSDSLHKISKIKL